MQAFPVPVLPSHPRMRPRTALVASADSSFRQRLSHVLSGLRWQVREAEGGAEAWAEAESAVPEAVIVDAWLPDLDLNEFVRDFRGNFPEVDLVTAAGSSAAESPRGPHRQELLYALRESQGTDTASWNAAPGTDGMERGRWPSQARRKSGMPRTVSRSRSARRSKHAGIAELPRLLPPIESEALLAPSASACLN